MSDWFHFKLLLIEHSGLSRDALHIFIGVLLQILIASMPRQSLARLSPWLMVLAVALANEWNDLRHESWPDLALQQMESIKDLLSTMALPTLLLMTARFAPSLMVGSPAREDPASFGSD